MKSLWAILAVLGWCAAADGQVFDRPIALPPAEIEPLDTASAAHLENAKRFLAERQWAEAVEAIRSAEEADASRLVRVEMADRAAGFERYVTAGEYCQWRLATLASEAPEALAHYRKLVDPLADSWFREGAKTNDERLLRRLVEQVFASSAADEALLKLGDLALARGDYAGARAAWKRIFSFTVSAEAATVLAAEPGTPLWLALRKFDFSGRGEPLAAALRSRDSVLPGVYPNSDIDPASVLARLTLASVLEGSPERARIEWSLLRLLYPDARGQMAGREGRYVDLMQDVLQESHRWTLRRESSDWVTFGGNATRGKIASLPADAPLEPLWTYPLPRLAGEREMIGAGRLRVAEDGRWLLSYYPVVVDQIVLVRLNRQGKSCVVALDLKTGRRLWQAEQNSGSASAAVEETNLENAADGGDAHETLTRHLGVARFTVTVAGDKLFARMGSPVTVPSSRRAAVWLAKDQGFLMGVDLKTQGRPLEGFPIRPPANDWTFEGAPVSDGGAIYVVMRRTEGARCQLYLAAFELQTTPAVEAAAQDGKEWSTGRLKWRTRICSSATFGGGEIDELTHLLVTKDHERLYLNTSAGAVAAVRADDGQLMWLVKYPRAVAGSGNPDRSEKHLFRDLTPCLVWKDLVIVAPADCDRIFALNAASGELAWTFGRGEADDVVQLLGAATDTLIAGGDSLYWIDAWQGRLLCRFPRGKLGGEEQSAPSPRGFGRGILTDHEVWWPTREAIYVFAAAAAESDFGWQPRLVRKFSLAAPHITGGNLIIGGGVLLIAGGDKLVAYGE